MLKNFYVHNLQIYIVRRVFVSMARILPKCRAPERCFTWIGSDLNHKLQVRLERLARDKHSSLLLTLVNYECKKFFNIGPGSQLVAQW